MKRITLLFIIICVSSLAAQTHFKYMRPVLVPDPSKPQAFMVLDETILTRMQATMGDIRLYTDAGREVPYILRTQRAVHYSAWKSARMLNNGLVGSDTQFIIDTDVA
ncbi:MAG TPA: hypothetical protein VM009_03445, partial [Terriglobales bacterium]|nr:hypothetical protein [Terriglobales bacterium]